jgi:uncharacterized protein (DUF58 family)
VVLLSAGLIRGVNLVLLVACLMLGLWLLSFVSAWRRLRGLQGKRVIDETVFAQTPFRLQIEVTNARRAAQIGIWLEDRGSGHRAQWFVSRLDGRQAQRFERPLVLPRRGRYQWPALIASTGYPFGFVQRRLALVPEQEVIVLPCLGRLHRGALRHFLTQVSPALDRLAGQPRRHPTAQSEFHGLRSFRSGDSPRWIHWRTSARRGELMVREFEDCPSDNLIVVLDPWLPAVGSPQSLSAPPTAVLEYALSLTATICWEWCRQTGDRLVLAIAGRRPKILSGITGQEFAAELLACLAVEEGTTEVDITSLLERLAQTPVPPGPALLVSTSPGGQEEPLAEALHRNVACLDVSLEMRGLGVLEGVYEPPPDAADPVTRSSGHAH